MGMARSTVAVSLRRRRTIDHGGGDDEVPAAHHAQVWKRKALS
jgi:hypothetical protein